MTATSDAKSLLQSSHRQHLMLLYNDERERNAAEIDCINSALADGWYCVYATVDADNNDFVARLVTLIDQYDMHIAEGNLAIVNFKPYYDYALKADLRLFDQLKADVEHALKNRTVLGKKEKALLIADAACNMSKHRQFEECISLETWWQNTYNDWKANNMDISIICAHPSLVLKHEDLELQRSRISNQHSLTIDLDGFIARNKDAGPPIQQAASSLPLRILLAEPEHDIRLMYKRYLESLPVELEVVENGLDCLEKAIVPSSRQDYDLIIIDTHINDASAIHIAKKIIEEKPDQEIVFSSTWSNSTFKSDLQSQSLDPDRYQILEKPFKFSQLLELIKPARKVRT